MDALTALLLRSARVLAIQGVRVDYILEIANIDPKTGTPTGYRTVMDERVGMVEYDIRDSASKVGDVFFCGEKEGRLVAYRFVPRLIELIVNQPEKGLPVSAPGIDVDVPAVDTQEKPVVKTL